MSKQLRGFVRSFFFCQRNFLELAHGSYKEHPKSSTLQGTSSAHREMGSKEAFCSFGKLSDGWGKDIYKYKHI